MTVHTHPASPSTPPLTRRRVPCSAEGMHAAGLGKVGHVLVQPTACVALLKLTDSHVSPASARPRPSVRCSRPRSAARRLGPPCTPFCTKGPHRMDPRTRTAPAADRSGASGCGPTPCPPRSRSRYRHRRAPLVAFMVFMMGSRSFRSPSVCNALSRWECLAQLLPESAGAAAGRQVQSRLG
jgi:hypothetical protein